jgi:hypothetical protein
MTQTFTEPHVRLTGRRVTLQPLTGQHVDALYAVTEKEPMADRWPRRGKRRSRDEFEELIWEAGTLQYAMLRQDTGELVGVVQGINQDDRNRTIDVSVIIDPDLWRRGWPFEGIVLFVNLLVEVKGFRKVYFLMPASTVEQVGGAMNTWLNQEATYHQHTRRGDGYEDVHVCSLFDHQWDPSLVDLVTRRTHAT